MRRALGIRNATFTEAMARTPKAGATTGEIQNVGRFYRSPVGMATDIFAPDVMMPAQFRRARSLAEMQPERRLLLAVLEDALDVLVKYRGVHDPKARAAFEEARAWFASDARGWPCAFVPVCEALGLDARAIRAQVLRPTFVPYRVSTGHRVAGVAG